MTNAELIRGLKRLLAKAEQDRANAVNWDDDFMLEVARDKIELYTHAIEVLEADEDDGK
jgi:hypothetical protein